MGSITRTALAIEKGLLAQFEQWMAQHGYTNRSEAVRDLIRSALIEDKWTDSDEKLVAVLAIVYDHESRQLAQELTHIQHEDHHAVLCSQHVHLDRHQCLEVIVLQGTAAQVRRMSDAIVTTRGVIAGKLSLLSLDV